MEVLISLLVAGLVWFLFASRPRPRPGPRHHAHKSARAQSGGRTSPDDDDGTSGLAGP